jgi:hypothetical protein
VSKSRKHSCCNDSPSIDPVVVDPSSLGQSRRISRRGRNGFPLDIKELLILLAEDEGDNDIDIVLKSSCPEHCFLRNVDPIAVFDNTLVIRDSEGCEGKFTYIDICCICTISFKCEALLDELFETHNISGE